MNLVFFRDNSGHEKTMHVLVVLHPYTHTSISRLSWFYKNMKLGEKSGEGKGKNRGKPIKG